MQQMNHSGDQSLKQTDFCRQKTHYKRNENYYNDTQIKISRFFRRDMMMNSFLYSSFVWGFASCMIFWENEAGKIN